MIMICENCGKEYFIKYGSGRFCCAKCARSFSTKAKRLDINKKVSDALKKSEAALTKTCICKVCNTHFTVVGRAKKTCSESCRNVIRQRNAKAGAKTKTLRGTHSGWHNRRGEQSYPEKYFLTLFENEGISGYVTEKKVGRWFIDFAFDDKMIAIEIDGRQHKDKERAETDKIKDEYLSQHGWRVFRIDWYNPINERNKQKLYPQIDEMKRLLKFGLVA